MRRGVVGAVAVVGLVAAIGGAWWLRGGFAARPRLVPLERATPAAERRAEPRVDEGPLAADARPLDGAPLEGTPLAAEAAVQRTETRGPRATVVRHGRVVAADSGIELADALIRLPAGAPGGLLRDGLFSLQRGPVLARSDANGRFAADVAADAGADDWIVIAAAGYAPRALAAAELGASAGGAPTFALERPARLRATVVAVDGTPAAGVSVRLVDRFDGARFVVEATTDETGVASLDGVPPECELAVELTEGRALLERESVTMRFASGATLTRRFALRAAAIVSGRVVDQDGLPVAGATVDARALIELADGQAAAEEQMREAESLEGAQRWWSSGVAVDDDGRFLLPIVEPCFVVVGVEPAPLELPNSQRWGQALAVVELPPGRRSATVTLAVERGLAITGRLVGLDDEPVAGTAVATWTFDGNFIEQENRLETGTDGRFAFHGVSRRTVLQLMGRSRDRALISQKPVAVRVADGEVTLRLVPRQRVLVRARDGASRFTLQDARLFAADGREWQPREEREEQLEDGAALECDAVPAGRYDLWVLAVPRWPEGGDAAGAEVPADDGGEEVTAEIPEELDPSAFAVAWTRGVDVAASGTTVVEVELQRAAELELLASEPSAGVVGARVLIDGRLFFKERVDVVPIGSADDLVARRLFLPPGEVVIEWIVAGRKTTEQLTLIAGETRRAAPPPPK